MSLGLQGRASGHQGAETVGASPATLQEPGGNDGCCSQLLDESKQKGQEASHRLSWEAGSLLPQRF